MGGTILLIDDDPDTLTYISTILLRGGYHILTANDGQEGWQLIREHRPGLILLDMMMPRRSGIQLLTELKNDAEYKDIPVFIISGVGQMTGVDMAKYLIDDHGCNNLKPQLFMEKPVKPDRLLKAVKEVLPD